MKGILKLFAILFLVVNSFSVNGQADSIRHQIGVGIWPFFQFYPYVNVEYKTFFKKRAFYNFSIGMSLTRSKSLNATNGYQYDIFGSSSVGLKYDFFNVCRFNMAAQVTGYFGRQHSRAREGLFIGPELGLELRAARFKSGEIAPFSKIQIGFGFIHERLNDSSPPYNYISDDIYFQGFGLIILGINYRF